jgi:hypothetical protein
MEQPTIRPGVYRHFKGGLYQVFGVAHLVDSSDYFVVYRSIKSGPTKGEDQFALRRLAEFAGVVIREGKEHRRFELVEEASCGHLPELLK